MSRKSGKPPRQPLSEQDRKELLNELDSVQAMLRNPEAEPGDEAGEPPLLEPQDRAPEPPVLEPCDPTPEASGDADQQMPLPHPEDREPAIRDKGRERPRQARREGPSPFLHDAARRSSPQSEPPASARPPSGANPPAPSRDSAPEGSAHVQGEGSNLSEQQMRALVDEMLSAWLPRIERELRDRLMEHLRGQ